MSPALLPRLGINIDHVATLRNARGGAYPDPARAAKLAEDAGADGITAHLREDRRHIRDEDLPRIVAATKLPLNLEMAATDEMVHVALGLRPHAVCLVPERREERTTEGGLDIAGSHNRVAPIIARLAEAGSRVSLFIGADSAQVEAARRTAARVVELHTGAFCDAVREGRGADAAFQLDLLRAAAVQAANLGLEVHAGHGIDYETVEPIAAIPEVTELNIGHFLVGEAVFVGLRPAIEEMRAGIRRARAADRVFARS